MDGKGVEGVAQGVEMSRGDDVGGLGVAGVTGVWSNWLFDFFFALITSCAAGRLAGFGWSTIAWWVSLFEIVCPRDRAPCWLRAVLRARASGSVTPNHRGLNLGIY